MVTLYNPNNNSLFVQYTDSTRSRVFRKELKPNFITALQHLATVDQINNLTFLTNHHVTVYNYDSNAFINQDTSFSTGYNGTTSATGMTLTVMGNPITTGWTFTTTAITVFNPSFANGTATGVTVGNVSTITVSGATTTQTWANTLYATSFSGFSNMTLAGMNTTNFVNSAGTQTFTLTADTISANNLSGFVFVPDDVQPWNYTYVTPTLAGTAAGYASLDTLVVSTL